MNIEKLTKLGKKLALKSPHYKHKMGCIIFKRNDIIGLGINKIRTHPRSKDPHHMLHAELSAILDVEEKDLEGASVLVYRERRCGGMGMAKPCSSCHTMLQQVGIKVVYYTTETGIKSYILNE